MSLKKKDKQTRLLHDRPDNMMLRAFNLSLVMMFFLQLILPLGAFAGELSNTNDSIEPSAIETQLNNSEESAEDIESPISMTSMSENSEEEIEEVNQPETPITPEAEEKEKAPDNTVEEPVNDPEENTNQQPPPSESEEQEVEEPAEEIEEAVKPAPEKSEAEQGSGEEKETVVEDEEESNVEKEEVKEAPEKVEEAEVIEPDAMLDGFAATSHPDMPASHILYYAPGSLGPFLALQQGMRTMQYTTNSELAPGEVKTEKTATRVPGMVNTWDIKVRIEGRDDNKVEYTDVVLVIDRSGSMDTRDNGNQYPTRLGYAKTAANNFIDEVIPADSNVRIAIVSFSSNYQGAELVTTNHGFSRNQTSLKAAVNNMVALGGTHTQAGIIRGQSLLSGSGANNKYMVLLSDGQPTYSYEPDNWQQGDARSWNWWGTPNGWHYHAIYDGNYDETSIVGDGSNLTDTISSGNNRYHINNGSAAIKAGQDARVYFDGLFTIAVQAGTAGTPILRDIASPGMDYSTNNPAELEEIYDEIKTTIQTQNALRNVVVTDEMGDGFSIIGAVTTTVGGTTIAAETSTQNETITWTIDPSVQALVPGTTDVRYAEMTYRVEINEDILNVPGAKTNAAQLFDTNKATKLTYTNTNDQRPTVDITSPKVDPVLLKIKKILKDANGNVVTNDQRTFDVNINKVTPNGYNHTRSLVPGADYVWLTSLRHEGTYNVLETAVNGLPASDPSDFIISYQVDDENKLTFEVNHINNKPRGDVTIEVTNKQFGDAIPDEPLIRLSKTFSGLTQDQINQLTNFKLTITSQADPTLTEDLFLVDAIRNVEANGDITYKWELEGWPAGTYTVTESGEEFLGYEVIIENDGTVTTEAATISWNTNLWKKPNTQENNDLTNGGQYDIPNIVATKLSSGSGVFVWTTTRLSASQRLAIVNALSGWNELGLTMDNGYWYSGEDIEGEHFYFRGYRIQYDRDTGNLHIPQPNQWALIVSGHYYFEGGDPADIAVKNTYQIKDIDFEFMKVDEIGNALEGSSFKLEKIVADGPNILMTNTAVDPQFLYAGLTVGEYLLTEEAAPDGYFLPDDNTWSFEVVRSVDTNQLEIQFATGDELDLNDDGEYVIANYPKGQLPDTGGPGITRSITTGILLLTMVGIVYVWRLKRDEVDYYG